MIFILPLSLCNTSRMRFRKIYLICIAKYCSNEVGKSSLLLSSSPWMLIHDFDLGMCWIGRLIVGLLEAEGIFYESRMLSEASSLILKSSIWNIINNLLESHVNLFHIFSCSLLLLPQNLGIAFQQYLQVILY